MKISLNWLKQFVDIPKNITPEKLAEVLTLKTVEVEGVEKQGKYLEEVVVGKIKEIKKHSNADKLKICIVDVGEKKDLQIICGGINLREGMLVAVAKIGAKVKWHGEEEMEIMKTKIRGEESFGMICTARELGLENIVRQEHEAEIVDLEKYQVSSIKYQAGQKLAEVFGMDDVIFDIDNKSITHRPDLWSHYGIAREIAAIFGCRFREAVEKNNFQFLISNFNIRKDKADREQEKMKISIDVKDSDLCPRYMAVAMSGIKIGQSPIWMQQRLSAVGMRPINNIVDITNFVMMELGQPMHAFSKSKVKKHALSLSKGQKSKVTIIVRRAGQDEKIKTLDGVERDLDESMLVIACLRRQADEEKPIAIAGVMGGENSEIDNNTAEIILESANFEKVNNRKTASKLGLRTEASARYEKGLDPNLCEQALIRCVELIREIIPGAVVSSDVVDVGAGPCACPQIGISLAYIRRKMGVEIEGKRVVEILEALGFGVGRDMPRRVSTMDKIFKITVPSWRATGDISIEDDIVEEVARIYGYDNIEPRMPEVSLKPPLENKERKLERRIKNILSIGFGMAETSNYSFVNEKQFENLGICENCVKLSNPLSSDHTLLRSSLIPNLLNNVKDNLRYFDEFAMFEIGSVFRDEDGNVPAKISNFQFPISNDKQTKSKLKKNNGNGDKNAIVQYLPWQEKFVAGIVVMGKDDIPFFKAKETVEGLLRDLGVNFSVEEYGKAEEGWMHPYRSSKFKVPANTAGRQSSKLGGQKLDLPARLRRQAQAGIRNWKLKGIVDIGYVTELSPVIAEEIGIKNARVGIFNLSLKALLELATDEKKYKKLLKFPSVIRDLAIVVDKKILYKEIVDLISGVDELIKSVELFDIFESEKIGVDKKSMAFHITFYSDEKTLTDEEVEIVFSKIVDRLEDKFGAEMRG